MRCRWARAPAEACPGKKAETAPMAGGGPEKMERPDRLTDRLPAALRGWVRALARVVFSLRGALLIVFLMASAAGESPSSTTGARGTTIFMTSGLSWISSTLAGAKGSMPVSFRASL